MSGVQANIALSIDATLIGSGDLGNPKQRVTIEELLALSAGTDAIDKANILFQDTRTIAASGNEDIDLAGALSDAFGASIAGAELVLLYVKAHSGNTNNVNVTRPASNGVPIFLAAGDGRAVKPGNFLLITDESGIGITAATADLINIANSGGTTGVTYDILVIGRTVAA
jgi:hypothetical protein